MCYATDMKKKPMSDDDGRLSLIGGIIILFINFNILQQNHGSKVDVGFAIIGFAIGLWLFVRGLIWQFRRNAKS